MPPGSETDDLGLQVRRAVARLHRRLRAERADGQLSDSQASILSKVVRDGPQSISALSEFEGMTPPSMNQIVNALVERGYVERQRTDRDRRQVLAVATELGIALTEANIRHRHEWLSAQLEQLSAEELRALEKAAAVMRRLADR